MVGNNIYGPDRPSVRPCVCNFLGAKLVLQFHRNYLKLSRINLYVV